ncbi:MAG TPA: SEC-C metal-binding domain-containing protein [Porticoccaceae bacterium]|nr:SEC-C metal-binding domain-containing protein [Porticoccaceae bacterium]
MATHQPSTDNELGFLLQTAAGQLYRSADPAAFLDWIARAGPLLAPQMSSQVAPGAGSVELFFRALGVEIYNHTPLADHGFSTRPLPRPGRNDPCRCGSGRKYKQCCAPLEDQPPLANYNMLRHVLDHCPAKVLATLPATGVDTDMLADTAEQWMDEGEPRRALALLEPWFKAGAALKRRHRPLFDLLMDIYLDQDKPIKRKRLLERACNAEDKQLRADALQRKASILMDSNQPEAAWETFRKAQRLDPESPSLALLELTLHCAAGDTAQARARAVFWLAKFRRDRGIDPELLQLLAGCTEDPEGVLLGAPASPFAAEITELIAILQAAPEPSRHYRVEIHGKEGVLVPNAELAKLETRWTALGHPRKPALTSTQHHDVGLWQDASRWLPLLRTEPTLWHSFEVLDDLVMAVDALELSGLEHTLLEPLLARAATLLDCNLADLPGDGSITLPWLMLENRPPLRLLAHRAFHLLHRGEGEGPAFIAAAERLIRLNPNDNHGIRAALSTAYIASNRARDAIALAAQYPEDILCTLPLNRVLALYLDKQQGKALSLLAGMAPDFKVAIDMLLAKNPRPPRLSDHGIRIGGKDEAWLYREATLHLWQRDSALAWLRKTRKSLSTSE